MLKKVKDLTDEEIIEILEKQDCKCKYCPFESFTTKSGNDYECPKDVKCYGGEPIYPACLDVGADKVYEEIVNNFRDQIEEIEA